MSDQQSYFEHLGKLAETLQGLIDKSMTKSLGPSDGDLYMQLCKLFEAHAALLEDQTRESIEKRRGNSSGDQKEDIEPTGDRPPDPES
jgi:hypothetical protein